LAEAFLAEEHLVPHEEHEYRLTSKGLALYPIIVGMANWGNAHSGIEASARLRLRHKGCGHSCRPALVCDVCGESVAAKDIDASALR
jgi:hypothetical protein